MPFESCRPARGFPSCKGQRIHIGPWWTATTGDLVDYESWLERDRLILLNIECTVVPVPKDPLERAGTR